MPPSHTTKRRTPDALGMKALITTTSLAVTLGGWAVLAVERPKAPIPEAPIADTVAIQPPPSGFELNLAPLPTIVGPPPPKIVIASPPPAAAIQRVIRQSAIQVVSEPTAAAQPAAAPPPTALPSLRVVSAPPKPVTRTHSSQ